MLTNSKEIPQFSVKSLYIATLTSIHPPGGQGDGYIKKDIDAIVVGGAHLIGITSYALHILDSIHGCCVTDETVFATQVTVIAKVK